jgi:hypothetical protein
LFGTGQGEVHVYSVTGDKQSVVNTAAALEGVSMSVLAGIEWSDSAVNQLHAQPCLCIAFTNGRAMLMTNPNDSSPILLDTYMTINSLQWNVHGNILAFAGSQVAHCLGAYGIKLLLYLNSIDHWLHLALVATA